MEIMVFCICYILRQLQIGGIYLKEGWDGNLSVKNSATRVKFLEIG